MDTLLDFRQMTVVITGGSDGIGAAAARILKAKGHDVVIVGRSKEKTSKLAKELSLHYHIADFSRLCEVRRLAKELEVYGPIAVLANNAGGVFGDRTITEDGCELTFQVNHLAPFLLTRLLMPQLVEGHAKVVQTASIAANFFVGKNYDITDLNVEKEYTPQKAYGYGKLENVLFTRELDRRYSAEGISAVCFHPGVVRSNFASETTTWFLRLAYHSFLKYLTTITVDDGAKPLVSLVEGKPGTDWKRGEFYSEKLTPLALDFEDPEGKIAIELWKRSDDLIEPFLKS